MNEMNYCSSSSSSSKREKGDERKREGGEILYCKIKCFLHRSKNEINLFICIIII
jgi:hypothetical protein